MRDAEQFNANDRWKALILYGLNQATYKIALGKALLALSLEGRNKVGWTDLATAFLAQYETRLQGRERMPQQATPGRLTKMERIVSAYALHGNKTRAVDEVAMQAFEDVIPRFHHLEGLSSMHGSFYRYQMGQYIELTDELHGIRETHLNELHEELDARWGLLEGAFSISAGDQTLSNDVREIYLVGASKRISLTGNVEFLQGYQGNVCFYCGEPMCSEIDVDHVLPRQVLLHDQIWNLVLSHRACNLRKLDRLVGPHFIEKLVARNENIMGSNHPWKKRIADALGTTPAKRRDKLRGHYDNVRTVLGGNYWGGSEGYTPENDPFYRRLITHLNNR